MMIDGIGTDEAAAEIAALMGDPDDDPIAEGHEEEHTEDVSAETGDPETDEESDEADPASDDAEDDPEKDGDDGEDEQEEQLDSVVHAPVYLGEEEKAEFDGLPVEGKKLFLKLEQGREAFKTQKLQEAAAARKEAAAEKQAYSERIDSLSGFVSAIDAELTMYEKTDWVAQAQRLSPEDYNAHRARFDHLKDQKAQAQQATEQAQEQEFQEHVKAEGALLRQRAPELAGNPEKLKAVGEYLANDYGYTPDTLKWASASDLEIAHKAYLFDQLQAKGSAPPKPNTGKSKRPGVKPGTSGKPVSQKSARKKALARKSSLNMDEAMEALMDID